MKTTTLETKVHDFLAQKRIAVAGVSRDKSHHPVGNLIYQRLKRTGHDVFPVNRTCRPSTAIAVIPTCNQFRVASTAW
jgi:predicted CoA-binding protein